jgi:tetratricopeptide (TPR) repeat protein
MLRILISSILTLSLLTSCGVRGGKELTEQEKEECLAHLQSARKLIQNQNYGKAIEELNSCLRINPQDYDAHFELGKVYTFQENYELAKEKLNETIRINPGEAEPHQYLARIFVAQTKYEDARRERKKAMELEPNTFNVRLDNVMYLIHDDVFLDLDEAMKELKVLKSLNPNAPIVDYLIGMVLLRMGKFKESVETLENLINQFQGNFETFYLLGIAYLRDGKYSKAVETLKEALKINPDNLETKWGLRLAVERGGGDLKKLEEPYRLNFPKVEIKGQVVRFKDVAQEAGVGKVDQGRGSGWADYDLDGDLDLFAVGVHSGTGLYQNNGDGTFSDVTERAGVSDPQGGWSALFADYDNDGDPDIYITRDAWEGVGRNTLYRNNGDGTFSDVTDEAGVGDKDKSSFTASFGDFDNDGYLDLLVTGGLKDGIQPNSLFLNNRDGTFTDVAQEAGLIHRGLTIGCAFGDYDDDGNLDIHIVHANGNNLLYKNNGNQTFTEVTEQTGARLSIMQGYVTFFLDYDNDGDLDLFTSSMGTMSEYIMSRKFGKAQSAAHQALLRNNGDGTFSDVTEESGLYLSFGSMGANRGDYDYDGDLDIYLANGGPPVVRLEPNALFRNNGDGTFTEITESAGVGNLGKGHGATFADYDQDGDLDIYSPVGGHYPADWTPNSLYQNPGTGNNYIIVRTVGTRSNRDGIGAKVKVISGDLSLLRVVDGGSGFGSTNSLELEFGLGKRTKVDRVEVRWPSGTTQTLTNPPVNQVHVITEPQETM